VTIQGFKPATANIRIEPVVESQVNVEVKFEGQLPDGFEVGHVLCSPSFVRLRGPADRMNAQRKATTETVWLDGRTQTFTLAGVAVNIPDPKIEMLDSTVDVRVELIEKKKAQIQPSSINLTQLTSLRN